MPAPSPASQNHQYIPRRIPLIGTAAGAASLQDGETPSTARAASLQDGAPQQPEQHLFKTVPPAAGTASLRDGELPAETVKTNCKRLKNSIISLS